MSEAGAAVAGDRPVIEATLEIAEPLGAETYLYLNAAGNHFIARVAPGDSLHHGDTVRIAFDMEKAHLYDATNEAVLA